MIDKLAPAALAIAGDGFDGLWEGAFIVGAVWLVLRCLPKLGAATRYAMWLCALAALVLIPVLTVVLSGHSSANENAAVAKGNQSAAQVPSIRDSRIEFAQTSFGPAGRPSEPVPAATRKSRITVQPNLAVAAALIWLLAAGARGLLLVLDVCRLGAIRRHARLWSEAHEYPVFLSSRVSVPLAIGFRRPAIILPASLVERMRDDAVQAILIHEIAHLRRNDVWTNAFARVGEALAALNPAAWFIMRRLAAEREIACDDWVIARTGDGGAFAQALATLAGGAAVRVPIAAAGAIGSRHSIVVRIERLLDSRPRHLRLSLSALGGTLMLLALIAFTVQSVSPALAIAPLAGPSSYHTATTTVAGCTRDRTPLREHRLGAGGPRMISPSLDAGSMQRIVARYPAFTTTYAVSVSAAGKPHDVVILHPSKDLAEDRAVTAAVLSSTFEPAFHNCAAVASTFRSASTQLPAPTVFLITRPATPVIYGTKPKTRTGACAVPHHDPAIVHLVRPEFTDSMKKLVLATQRTYLNTVNVQLDASGAVQNAMVGKSSGRKAFDEATLAAARETTYAPRVEHCSHIPGTYFVMAAYTDRLEP